MTMQSPPAIVLSNTAAKIDVAKDCKFTFSSKITLQEGILRAPSE